MEQNISGRHAPSGVANHDVEEAHGEIKSYTLREDGDFEDEVRRLENDMRIVLEEVSKSVIYRNITYQLRSERGIQSNILRVLGSEKHIVMVLYALGSLEENYRAQKQLGLALLLKRDFNWIEEIEVFDPLISSVDRKVIEELGCSVLCVNEHCRRRVTRPTLFFMPFPEIQLKRNLFEANVLPSQLNQMVLLSNNEIFEPDRIPFSFEESEYREYRMALRNFTSSFELNPFPEDSETDFAYFHWSFFHVGNDFDMKKFLPASVVEKTNVKDDNVDDSLNYEDLRQSTEETLDLIFSNDEAASNDIFKGCRLPPKFRSAGFSPRAGWVKLNFSGRGFDGHRPAGFGGIFHDQFNDCIGSYHGSLGDADEIVASAEALREGMRCIHPITPVRRLFILGDELRIILWIHQVLHFPLKVEEQMVEIFEFLQNKIFLVGHINEEANAAAIELAEKGTASQERRLWIVDLPTIALQLSVAYSQWRKLQAHLDLSSFTVFVKDGFYLDIFIGDSSAKP